MSDLKPKNPSHDGRQFARNPYGDNELSVRRDAENNEIPEDRPMHKNSTPEQGRSEPNYDGPQYHELDSYGKGTSGSNSVSRSSVDVSRSNRGKDQ